MCKKAQFVRNNDGAVNGEKIMAKYIGMIETVINSFKICT